MPSKEKWRLPVASGPSVKKKRWPPGGSSLSTTLMVWISCSRRPRWPLGEAAQGAWPAHSLRLHEGGAQQGQPSPRFSPPPR